MITEKKKASNARWDKENILTVSCRLRKEEAQNLRIYAESQGLTLGAFARLALRYCKNNNINLQQEPEEENNEK